MTFWRFVLDNRLFLLAGALISFSSSYGQTYFISIFSAQIRGELGLSNAGWGGIYTLGTTASAALMLWGGPLTDRFRARRLTVLVMGGLIVACLGMALVTGPVMLVAVIFMLRFFGQGMMPQMAAVSMARWFTKMRGRALSISSTGFAIGQAVLPIAFVAMAGALSWRWLWVLAALMALLTLPLVQYLLKAEREPSSFSGEEDSVGMGGRHWSRSQMLRHPLFWCLVPMQLGPSAWGTVLFFQQVPLAEAKGWTLAGFVALMPVFITVSIAMSFVGGWMIDRIGSGRLLRLSMLPWALGFAVIAWAPTLGWAALGMGIFGVGTGINSTLSSAFWAEYYGTAQIGAIKSVAGAVMVLGSAIGPGVSGVLLDQGMEVPAQLFFFAVYFLAAGGGVVFGLARFAPRSASLA